MRKAIHMAVLLLGGALLASGCEIGLPFGHARVSLWVQNERPDPLHVVHEQRSTGTESYVGYIEYLIPPMSALEVSSLIDTDEYEGENDVWAVYTRECRLLLRVQRSIDNGRIGIRVAEAIEVVYNEFPTRAFPSGDARAEQILEGYRCESRTGLDFPPHLYSLSPSGPSQTVARAARPRG